ncbi:hypothetical protein D3C85_1217140 [compost metagenome]
MSTTNAWRWLNEHAALPLSVLALMFTGLSYCGDRQDAAEARAITQSVIWRSEKLPNGEGLGLKQPNDAIAIRRVVFEFPESIRQSPITLPPSDLHFRSTWIRAGVAERLAGCTSDKASSVVEGDLPIQVTTHYSVAGKNRSVSDVYALSYLASVTDAGMVDLTLQAFAISGEPLLYKNTVAEGLDVLAGKSGCRAVPAPPGSSLARRP